MLYDDIYNRAYNLGSNVKIERVYVTTVTPTMNSGIVWWSRDNQFCDNGREQIVHAFYNRENETIFEAGNYCRDEEGAIEAFNRRTGLS